MGRGAVIALDPNTGQRKWTFEQYDVTDSGILTTASDLLFTGGREGYFYALDARTGAVLWKASLGGQIVNGPVSYEVDGRQRGHDRGQLPRGVRPRGTEAVYCRLPAGCATQVAILLRLGNGRDPGAMSFCFCSRCLDFSDLSPIVRSCLGPHRAGHG